LGHATYFITEAIIQKLIQLPTQLSIPASIELRKISGMLFKNEISLINIISTFSTNSEILGPAILLKLLSYSLVSDCGKSVLLPDAPSASSNPLDVNSIVVGFEAQPISVFTTELITSANLNPWPVIINKEVAIDAERGRFMFKNTPASGEEIYIAYHYGFSGPIGAGSYERAWIDDSIPDLLKSGGGGITYDPEMKYNPMIQIEDSKTYGPVRSNPDITKMVLQAKSKERPYLCLRSNWILNSGSNSNSSITLDGLWIGGKGNRSTHIILKGDFECVVIRNCTFDPGGSTNIKGENLRPVTLSIEGNVENLCIESSIMGPIRVITPGILNPPRRPHTPGFVEEFSISDSIVQSVDLNVKAIDIKTGKSHIDRTTIFGEVDVHSLYASEALITGLVNVIDTQNGCFRFGAAQSISRLPHPYESFLFNKDTNHWFTSRRFADPGYAQLSETAPPNIFEGAENGSEMGAFCNLLNPIKLKDLQSKIDEYMPFGLIPIFVNNT